MAVTKLKLKQVENSSTPGSIPAYDASNVLSIIAPTTGADRIPFYDDSATAMAFLTLGTNLSISGTTINATAGAGGYATIQEEGSTVGASNTTINFVGSMFTAADAGSGVTSVTGNSFLNTLATAGTILLSSGNVSGTLAVANGGTGAVTLTGLLQGNGTSAVTAITNSSTVGQILRVTGASTYGWGALDLSDTDAITGDLPFANLAQGSALSVLGVTGNATADNASIAAGTDHQVLRRSGTALAFGAVNLAQSAAVTGILAIANGGTGSATQNFVDLSTTQTVGGTKTFSNNITINGTPSASTDAATVGYVTTAIAGIRKGSVRAATTANGTLATAFANGQVIDGVTLVTGDLILLKNQTTQAENGAYTVNASGAPTRATWMDAANEIDGVYVAVEDGTTLAGTLWITVSEVTTLGTDAIVFTQIQTSGTIAGSIASGQVGYGSGTNILTSTSTFLFDGTRLSINDASPTASTILNTKGGGTGNSTYGLLHKNSSGTQTFRVADDGTTVFGTTDTITVTGTGITRSGGALSITAPSGQIININNGNGGTFKWGAGYTWTATSGAEVAASTTSSVAYSSGTATFVSLALTPSITQTGGASGITRGLYVNPTLTTAADFRGIEVNASSGYAIYTAAGKVRHDLGSDATGDTWYRGAGGEMTRLAAGATAGHVLTSNGSGAAPSWQATATATVVTRAYLTGSTASVIDLDSGTAVTDINGSNVTFTTSGLSADQIFVVRNGVTLSQSGTVSRDYTLVPSTGVLTLATALSTDESLLVYKIV